MRYCIGCVKTKMSGMHRFIFWYWVAVSIIHMGSKDSGQMLRVIQVVFCDPRQGVQEQYSFGSVLTGHFTVSFFITTTIEKHSWPEESTRTETRSNSLYGPFCTWPTTKISLYCLLKKAPPYHHHPKGIEFIPVEKLLEDLIQIGSAPIVPETSPGREGCVACQ